MANDCKNCKTHLLDSSYIQIHTHVGKNTQRDIGDLGVLKVIEVAEQS